MPFKKGDKKPPSSGKKKGTENKATKDIKEAYRMLIEKNLDNMTLWLSRIARNDPAKAIYILADLSEYVIPKLARTDVDLTSKGAKLGEMTEDEFNQRLLKAKKILNADK